MGEGVENGPAGDLDFRLFGGLSVRRGAVELDLPRPKQRAVLAVLLLELDRVVPADRIIELLWGDDSDKALASLQAYISRLRTVLEPERRPRDPATVLVSRPPGYRLAVPRAAVDLHRFEDGVAAGLERSRQGAFDDAAALLVAALGIWTGPLLPELADEPFVVAAAQRATATRVAAIEALGEARLQLGDHVGAVAVLEPEADQHPQREHLHELLALALYRGRPPVGRPARHRQVPQGARRARRTRPRAQPAQARSGPARPVAGARLDAAVRSRREGRHDGRRVVARRRPGHADAC